MGKRELQLLRLIMDDGVEVFTPHFFFQQVEQAVSRLVNLIVVVERETGVQIGITPQPGDDEVFVVGIVAEQFGIGDEGHLGTVGFLGRPGLLVHQDSLGEGGTVEGSVPEACDHEMGRKCIHSLGSHPVQADGKLKYIVAVFCTGVDDRNTLDHLAKRYAAAVVAHPHFALLATDDNLIAKAHDEFIDAVVHHLLEQDVDAVIDMRTISQPPDIHAWTLSYMLQRTKRLDF